jgi:hypothetical protein
MTIVTNLDLRDVMYATWPQQDKPVKQGRVSPSKIVSGCLLTCYHDLLESAFVSENRTAEDRMITDCGDWAHDRIQTYFQPYYEERDWVYLPEFSVQIAPNSWGSIDAYTIVGDEVVLHDYKTCSMSVFKSLGTTPPDKNLKQIQLYLHGAKARWGVLFYVRRDNFQMKQFLVEYDPRIVEPLLAKIQEVNDAALSKVPPLATVHFPTGSPCTRSCNYRNLCPEAVGNSRKI